MTRLTLAALLVAFVALTGVATLAIADDPPPPPPPPPPPQTTHPAPGPYLLHPEGKPARHVDISQGGLLWDITRASGPLVKYHPHTTGGGEDCYVRDLANPYGSGYLIYIFYEDGTYEVLDSDGSIWEKGTYERLVGPPIP